MTINYRRNSKEAVAENSVLKKISGTKWGHIKGNYTMRIFITLTLR